VEAGGLPMFLSGRSLVFLASANPVRPVL